MPKKKSNAEDVKKQLTTRRRKRSPVKGLSTGSILLNLACSGNPDFGLYQGKYYFFVGASRSGKTWKSLEILAEANRNPDFQDYDLVYDGAEDGALMDMDHYFGKGITQRIQPPKEKNGVPVFSSLVEEFYDNVDALLDTKKPFIYVLDSMDSLDAESDRDKIDKDRTKREKGDQTSGTYGLGKPKVNSQRLRSLMSRLRNTGSILIIIAQTRDNINPMSFEKETRGGGRALTFYATLEIWTSLQASIKKTVKGKTRNIGQELKFTIKKNRINGKKRTVILPFYESHGFDETGACVKYLIDEGHWSKTKTTVKAPEFDLECQEETLIKKIEEMDKEEELRQLTAQVWNEIEESCKIQRKSRY